MRAASLIKSSQVRGGKPIRWKTFRAALFQVHENQRGEGSHFQPLDTRTGAIVYFDKHHKWMTHGESMKTITLGVSLRKGGHRETRILFASKVGTG